MDLLFEKIAIALPGAHILLFGENTPDYDQLLKKRLRRSLGELAERVIIKPRMSHSHYLQAIKISTLVIDTPHYSGVNTAFDALAMGKAIITMPGTTYRSRTTAALLTQMDCLETIVVTPEEYLEMVVKLCRDHSSLRIGEVPVARYTPRQR